MKHLSALLCALILILSIPVIAHAEQDVYTEGTLYYTIGDETVTIVGCFGKKTEVTVPANIAGYPVNTIAAGAFTSNRYIEKLNLPDTITAVETGAIPESVRVIYNANTDHPQDFPTDLITGKEPVLVPEQPKGTQPATSAEQKNNPSEHQHSAVTSNSGGDRVLEGDVVDDDEPAQGTAGGASAASQASGTAGSASSAPSASQPSVSATDSPASTASAERQTTADSANQEASGGVPIWLIAGIAVIVVAGAVTAFFIIRKKNSGNRQEKP